MKAISHKWLSFALVATGTVLSTMDSSIILISLPELTKVFDTTPSVIVWVILAYNLTVTGTVLILGRLADTLGRQRVYRFGFLVFTAGLILSSLSQNVFQLIGVRAIAAIGSAMLASSGNAIITAAFPLHEKGKAIGIVEAAAGVGLASGPALGGFLLDLLGWRAIFYLRLPLCILASAATWKFLKEEAPVERSKKFDFYGAATLFGGLSSLLLAVNQSQPRGWFSPFVLTFLAVAIVLLSLFIGIEKKATQPVVDLALFRNRLFSTFNAILFLYHMASTMLLFLMPFFMISAIGYSSAQAGLLIMIFPGMLVVLGPVSGWLSDRLGPRLLPSIGLGLQALALFLISQLNADSSLADVITRLLLGGVGTGFFSSPVYSTIMGAVPRQRLGTASAMIPTIRNVGIACGMAVGGAIFVSRQAHHLAYLSTAAPQAAENLSLIAGFHDAILVAAAVSLAGVVVAVFPPGNRSDPGVQKLEGRS